MDKAAGVENRTPAIDEVAHDQALRNYLQLPLSFEPNVTDASSAARFVSYAGPFSVAVLPTELALTMRITEKHKQIGSRNFSPPAFEPKTIHLRTLNSRPNTEITGFDELPGKTNYFLGNDPANWHTDVPTYSRVRYADVYPGIDLFYYGNRSSLEYDFVIAPHVDPNQISIEVAGADKLKLNSRGELVIESGASQLRQQRPVIYQEVDGGRQSVSGGYRLDGNKVSFDLGAYDESRPLIIDPVIVYSTLFGGDKAPGMGFGPWDFANGIAIDLAGNAYITGTTHTIDFPTVNPIQGFTGHPTTGNIFVTKINAGGNAIIYSTYLGGGGIDSNGWEAFLFSNLDDGNGNCIALDAGQNVYVTGLTTSTDFPTTNPIQSSLSGQADAFVTKLNASGSALIYSTYVGGSLEDSGNAIAVDAAGAVIAGYTASGNFPVHNALQNSMKGSSDAFVTRLNPTGSAVVYSTFLGSSANSNDGTPFDEGATGVALDQSGSVYLTGVARGPDFPILNAAQPAFAGTMMGFVTKFSATGASLLYSTFIGAGTFILPKSIAVDSNGNAYVAGDVEGEFPTRNAIQPIYRGNGDGFVLKLNHTGNSVIYATYLGGSGDERLRAIAVDNTGTAYVTGGTTSADFVILNSLHTFQGEADAFVTKISESGLLVYSTYLGGSSRDVGKAIAVDTNGNAYVAGYSASIEFPLLNSIKPVSVADAFVTKIFDSATLAVGAISPNHGGNNGQVSVTVAGAAFNNSATVKLRTAGQPDIVAFDGQVLNASKINASFNLRGATPGPRDVVVNLSGGAEAVLPNGFMIESGGAAEPWIDLLGRQTIRLNSPATFYLTFGNRGNADAYATPVWLGGIPKNATVKVGVTTANPDGVPGGPIDWSQVPLTVSNDNEQRLPLLLPFIPAGYTGTISISISVPTQQQFEMRAWVNPPLVRDPQSLSAILTSDQAIECYLAIFDAAINVMGLQRPANCIAAIRDFLVSQIITGIQTARAFWRQTAVIETFVQSMNKINLASLKAGLQCAQLFPTLAAMISAIELALSTAELIVDCGPVLQHLAERNGGGIQIVASRDPNDKAGAVGAGPQKFITGKEPLRYSLFFENVPSASAPAQEVLVTDQLQTSSLDLSTFSLSAVGFGNQTVIPPHGLKSFQTEVDLRPAKNLVVSISIFLDNGGLLTSRFTSLDPATGLPPSDPLAGFLAPGEEGSIVFTVAPKTNLNTGAVIINGASIVFDKNGIIATPIWSNAIDNTAPTSHVLPLSPTQTAASFKVQWSAADTGSGVGDYSIYVSDNGAPFTPWLVRTNATEAFFPSTANHAYSFFSIAYDLTGNSEAAKTLAEASTQVVGSAAINAKVVDPFGNPINNVALTLTGARSASANTGANGTTAFPGLPTSAYQLMPAKAGYVFSPPSISFDSLLADQTANFVGRAAAGAPLLITAADSTRALAFDSVAFLPEPFPLTSPLRFSPDQRTRVMLFLMKFDFLPGENLSILNVTAEDTGHHVYPLSVESAGRVPGYFWLSYVIVRLSDEMGDLGDVLVRVSVRGVSSNRARIAIGHLGDGPADDPGAVPVPGREP